MVKRTFACIISSLFIANLIAQNSDILIPSNLKREQVIHHQGFSLSYSSAFVLSSWVSYKVPTTTAKLEKLKGKYVEDPQVSTRSASKKDYKNSGYLMAQIANTRDVIHTEGAKEESFYMTNIVPMKIAFHKHIWTKSENLVRIWAEEYGELLVVAGPILKEGPFPTIGSGKVSIPKNFFKVVYDSRSGEAIAFKFKNGISSGKLKGFSMSVAKLEELTGIDYFPDMDEEQKKKIKSTVNYDHWDFESVDGK